MFDDGATSAYLDELAVKNGEIEKPKGVVVSFCFPIAPVRIVIPHQGLLSSFGSSEREDVAEAVVRVAQEAGGWKTFNKDNAEKMWRATPPEKESDDYFAFYSLQRSGHFVEVSPGIFQVTSEFVRTCLTSAAKYADH